MRVNKTNNINFGYNKRLNEQLKERLAQSPTPLNQSIARINKNCNDVENTIRMLECRGIDKNREQINILLDYFLDAKEFLCDIVDRLFPDLNFKKTECDTYDQEAVERIIPDEVFTPVGPPLAYMWRETFVDNLLIEDDKDANKKILEVYEPTQKESKKITGAPGADLVEKYVAQANAPRSLDDVIGLKNIRDDIEDLIIYPILNPNEAKQRQADYGIEVPSFVMLYGPPGCGKTMIAEAISNYSASDMYLLDLSRVGSSYINESSTNIAKAFEYVFKQAESAHKPVILFMDEMDSLLSKRNNESGGSSEDNKVVNTLLPLIVKSKDKNVMIIGATNMYNLIDPAAKRRVDLEEFVGLPDEKERVELMEKYFSGLQKAKTLLNNRAELEEISKELQDYSPSTIINILKYAMKLAYRQHREVEKEDILKTLKEGSWEKIKINDYLPENKKNAKIGFAL